PELTPTPCVAPAYAASACSKPEICGPMLSDGERSTWFTAAISASVRSGEDIGMCIDSYASLYDNVRLENDAHIVDDRVAHRRNHRVASPNPARLVRVPP